MKPQSDKAAKVSNECGDGDNAVAQKRRSAPAPKRAASPHERAEASHGAEKAELRAQLETCVKANDDEGCKAVLEKLSKIGGNDAVCYNMLISNCAKQGQAAEAEAWMKRLLESGVKPDTASFNATIDAWARAGDASRAEQW